MTESEATALMAELAAAYPNQQILEETFRVYAGDLLDVDYAVAREAATRVRRTLRRFPTIADLREAAAEIILGAPSLMAAWEQALRGPGRHELVRRARRMVGDDFDWRVQPTDSLRPAFMAAYKELRAEAVLEVVAPQPILASSGVAAALGPGEEA